MRLGDVAEGARVRFPDGDEAIVVRQGRLLTSVRVRSKETRERDVAFATSEGKVVRFRRARRRAFRLPLPVDLEVEEAR